MLCSKFGRLHGIAEQDVQDAIFLRECLFPAFRTASSSNTHVNGRLLRHRNPAQAVAPRPSARLSHDRADDIWPAVGSQLTDVIGYVAYVVLQ
jgi:hypothetical protein